MESFIKILDQLLINFNKSFNEKITGISFLEQLKFDLIEKLINFDHEVLKKLMLEISKKKYFEKKIDHEFRELFYKIEHFDKSVSKIKTKTENNFLCIVIDGIKKISIFDKNEKNKYIKSILLKNMGFVGCHKSIISAEINKNSIILTLSIN